MSRRDEGFRYATGFYCGPPAAVGASTARSTTPTRSARRPTATPIRGASPGAGTCFRQDAAMLGRSPSTSSSRLGRAGRPQDSPRSSRFGPGWSTSTTMEKPEDHRNFDLHYPPSLHKSVGSTSSCTPKRLLRQGYSSSVPSLPGKSKEPNDSHPTPAPKRFGGSDFSAEQWALATSCERLEGLRQRLRKIREEKELIMSSQKADELAARRARADLDANRKLLVKLRSDEQRLQADEHAEPAASAQERHLAELERRVVAKRQEVFELGEAVFDFAQKYVAKNQNWKDLIDEAACARALAAVPAARKEAAEMLEQEQTAHSELKDAEAQLQAVRDKCRMTRYELSEYRSSLEKAAENAEKLAWSVEGAETELAQERRRREESAQLCEKEETQLQELRRRVEAHSKECSASKVVTRRLACQFRHAEQHLQDFPSDGLHSSMSHQSLLHGLRRRADFASSTRLQAEAELNAQRDASRSWLRTVELLSAGDN